MENKKQIELLQEKKKKLQEAQKKVLPNVCGLTNNRK